MLERYWVNTQQKLADLDVSRMPNNERIIQDQAHRYEIALRFEDGFPAVSEWISMARRVGLSHVVRMTLKRMRNLYRDNR